MGSSNHSFARRAVAVLQLLAIAFFLTGPEPMINVKKAWISCPNVASKLPRLFIMRCARISSCRRNRRRRYSDAASDQLVLDTFVRDTEDATSSALDLPDGVLVMRRLWMPGILHAKAGDTQLPSALGSPRGRLRWGDNPLARTPCSGQSRACSPDAPFDAKLPVKLNICLASDFRPSSGTR